MGRSHVLRRHGKVRPHEWHSRDRMFDLSLERIPEVVLMIILFSLSLFQLDYVDQQTDNSFKNAPLAYVNKTGMCQGYSCTDESVLNGGDGHNYYTAVITYMESDEYYDAKKNYDSLTQNGTATYMLGRLIDSHGIGVPYKPSKSRKKFRSMDFIQYLSRFGVFTKNICPDQNSFTECCPSPESEPCGGAEMLTLSDLPWFHATTHNYVAPLYPPSEAKCHPDATYLLQFLFSMGSMEQICELSINNPAQKPSQTPEKEWESTQRKSKEVCGRAPAISNSDLRICSTFCCAAARVAQSSIQARYICGSGAGLTHAMFIISNLLMVLIFMAPALSAIFPFWLMGYSHISLMLYRTTGFKSYIPDPRFHAPAEVFLTDGGHIDNSGAFPLLRRKCQTILAVDSDKTRRCNSLYLLMELSRRRLDCAWMVPAKEEATVDPIDYMLDFRLPRARYVGHGEEAAADHEALLAREAATRELMLGDVEIDDPKLNSKWRKQALKQLISHVRSRNGHSYVYFMDEKSLALAFKHYPFLKEDLKICQSLEKKFMKDLDVHENFLPTVVIENETLRHFVHFVVRYNDGVMCNFYFIRGEHSPEDLADVHAELSQYEPSKAPWTTLGDYPYNSTLGEGYTWAHVNAYAEYCRKSLKSAWLHGLKDQVNSSQVMLEDDAEKVDDLEMKDGFEPDFEVPELQYKPDTKPNGGANGSAIAQV